MLSVVICTYNRERLLGETVKSFLGCRNDGVEHEVVVVDNNSTDGTRAAVERLCAQGSRIRYVFEPAQGLSHARNTGIRASRGESIAFVDDDVYFSPDWLGSLASALERHADADCIGGKVLVHFDAERPGWLDDDLLWVYAITRYGEDERELRLPELPRGCNLAIRRRVFERIGVFHTSLGRKGGNLLSCDENHFFLRAARAGLKVVYSPAARVSHRISSARTTRGWMLKRYYWEGISATVMRQLGDEPSTRAVLAKEIAKAVPTLLRQLGTVAGPLSVGRGYPDRDFKKLLGFCYGLGELRQMTSQLLAPVTAPTATALRGEDE